MATPFQGAATALSSDGLNRAAGNIGVHAPEVWTVLGVETSGCGFLPDRRPQILFERHIFHRLTGGQYDDGQISNPTPGGYGAYGAHQYDRLALAITKDRNAALQSASWGIGQIMAMKLSCGRLQQRGRHGCGHVRFRRPAAWLFRQLPAGYQAGVGSAIARLDNLCPLL